MLGMEMQRSDTDVLYFDSMVFLLFSIIVCLSCVLLWCVLLWYLQVHGIVGSIDKE